jgi:hypothetical protein
MVRARYGLVHHTTESCESTAETWGLFGVGRILPVFFAVRTLVRVTTFYREQHLKMTYDFVLQMEDRYLNRPTPVRAGIWDMLEYISRIIDDSDPDTNLRCQTTHSTPTTDHSRTHEPPI